MSWVTRWANLFRRERIGREIDEEMESHLAEALEHGQTALEAHHALGASLRYREQSRDIRFLPAVESLFRDAVFGWRQLKRNRTASAAAILSLALAIGSATAAFRLVDALLLRTLPVAEPERLSVAAIRYLDRDGRPKETDHFDQRDFRAYSAALAGRADVMGISPVYSRLDAILAPTRGLERFYRQNLSGNAFAIFGLRPALGRLLTPADDSAAAQSVAVLSYDFWVRRYARDPNVLGKTFRMRDERDVSESAVEIVGVAPEGFTGTDPGLPTDFFLPARITGGFRIWLRPNRGVAEEEIRQRLQAALLHDHQKHLEDFPAGTPRPVLEAFLHQQILLTPAASGVSRIQQEYRRPLLILTALVALVLLLACANAGNLLTAQAAARAREMALRVSIGAGKGRLIQLVLMESAMLAAIASGLGWLFAWWAAPAVLPLLHLPGDPVRLVFETRWRQAAFSLALAFLVTLLFGLAPALRASSVQPMSAIRGGQDPHARRRLRNVLLAAQMAFCVLVQFVAGLFVATFQRLANKPLGLSYGNVQVVYLDGRLDQPPEAWMQTAQQISRLPGVESVSLVSEPLLSTGRWSRPVRLPGHAVELIPPYCLDISPHFFDTMRIGRIDGRDFRPGDNGPRVDKPAGALAGVGIVNQSFARVYFGGGDPVGRPVEVMVAKDVWAPMQIVGYVRDAAHADLREPMMPVFYVPQAPRQVNSLLVRSAGEATLPAETLRRELGRASPAFEVTQIQPGSNFIEWHLVRERLLALLSAFFAAVALALAAIGLYGVLNYAVTERRREISIRMAIGARSAQVVRPIVGRAAAMVTMGAAIGVACGLAGGRIFGALLYEVRPTDTGAVAIPLAILLAAGILAAVPPALRAVRIDPARTLRSE